MKTYAQITGYWTSNPNELFTEIVCLGHWDNDDRDDEIIFYMEDEPLNAGAKLDLNVSDDTYIVKSINSVFTE